MGNDGEVLLIGFGNMGQALVRGWLAKGIAAHAIRVVDPAPAARAVAAQLGVAASERAEPLATRPGVVLLAVKPNQLAAALAASRSNAAGGTVHLSIAAGKTLAQLEADAMLSAMLRRITRFEAAGDPEPWMTTVGHGPARLPVRVIAP